MKRMKRTGSSATYKVRSTDDGFSAEDEGSDSNVDNRTTIVSRTEARSAELTITLPEVPSERPDTAQTLIASVNAAADEIDSSLRPRSASSDTVPQGQSGDSNTPPGSTVNDVQQSCVGAMTSWNITFDGENDSRPKGRQSMPGLASLTKRFTPARKPEAKSRKSSSPATGVGKMARSSTTKGTQSVKSPLHSVVSNRKQVDKNTATASGGALKEAEPSAVKGVGSSAPGRRTPQGQSGARKEVAAKSVSATTVKTAQKKRAFPKTETAVSGKGQRSSSPFTRNTSDRRTYTKKEGASTPDLPHINAERTKKTPSRKQTTPKSHDSHVTGTKRGSAPTHTPLAKEQLSARTAAMGKEVNTTMLVVDTECEKNRPTELSLEKGAKEDLSPRKVVGEEDAGGAPSDGEANPEVKGEALGEAPSIPSGMDSVIVAAHFGEADCEAHSGEGVPHEELIGQGR